MSIHPQQKEEAAENQPYQVASENRTGSSVHLNFDESRTFPVTHLNGAQFLGFVCCADSVGLLSSCLVSCG